MFIRSRRIFAVGIDSLCLLPYVFWVSTAIYNQVINFGGINVQSLEFVLFINRGGVTLYMVMLFPLVYVIYEFICYLLFKQTLGQYFMQLHLRSIDFLTMLFRMFFTISLQIVSVGIFNLFNIVITIITGKTIIDYLSRSRPEQVNSPKISHPKFKLALLLTIVIVMSIASMSLAIVLENRCFEISCIEKIVLKDVIDQQVQQRQVELINGGEQIVKVNARTYSELVSEFPQAEALALVPKQEQGYDLIAMTVTQEFQMYSTQDNYVSVLAANEPWEILTVKNQLDQQKWQVFIWSESKQQFLPVRAVFNIQNQNSYSWMVNVSESGNINNQLLLTFKHDFGTQSKITLEK
ncbi:MAG: RDD family protein [Culicoidibacterales bacterium]